MSIKNANGTKTYFNVDATNGNTEISGNLDVSRITILRNDLRIMDVSDNIRFRVKGDTGDVDTSGTLTINNIIDVGGTTTLRNHLSIKDVSDNIMFHVKGGTGNTEISGNLDVLNITTLNDNLSIKNADGTKTYFNVDASNGDTDISGTLTVDNVTTLKDKLSIVNRIRPFPSYGIYHFSQTYQNIMGDESLSSSTLYHSRAIRYSTEITHISSSSNSNIFKKDKSIRLLAPISNSAYGVFNGDSFFGLTILVNGNTSSVTFSTATVTNMEVIWHFMYRKSWVAQDSFKMKVLWGGTAPSDRDWVKTWDGKSSPTASG